MFLFMRDQMVSVCEERDARSQPYASTTFLENLEGDFGCENGP